MRNTSEGCILSEQEASSLNAYENANRHKWYNMRKGNH